jgi:hypothetical protein
MRRGLLFVVSVVAAIVALTIYLSRDRGDSTHPTRPAQAKPLPPKARLHFRLHERFEIRSVAEEPLIEAPVAAAWDAEGGLWIVEQLAPSVDAGSASSGRVIKLEDADRDGTLDRRKVIVDQLVKPTGVLTLRDGVLVPDAPHLWLCRDTDGNQTIDERTDLANLVPAVERSSAVGRGILWALDNWVYTAGGTYRFRPVAGQWISERTYARGQTGLTQDNSGRFYYCVDSDPLRVDLLPAGVLERNPHHTGVSGTSIPVTRTAFSRQLDGVANEPKSTLVASPALSALSALMSPLSALVYRGGSLPQKVDGAAFVCDPGLNLVRCLRLHRAGFARETRQSILVEIADEGGDFLTSNDPDFRPVHLTSGPDGALYVVDFVNEGELPDQSGGAEKLAASTQRGHIYRVSYAAYTPGLDYSSRPVTAADWLKLLSHPGGWWRDMAQHSLVQFGDSSLAPQLRHAVKSEPTPLGRLHALMTLEGMGTLDWDTWAIALRDQDPVVSVAAVRLSEPWLNTQNRQYILNQFAGVAKAKELFMDLQLQLLIALGASPQPDVEPLVAELIARGFHGDFHLHAALSAVPNLELELMLRLVADPRCAASGSHLQVIEALGAAIGVERVPDRIAMAVDVAASQTSSSPGTSLGVLNGLLRGWAAKSQEQPVQSGKPGTVGVRSESWATLEKCSDALVRQRAVQLREYLTGGGGDR